MCKKFIGSIVTELTTQESRRIDAFVTHWQAALPPRPARAHRSPVDKIPGRDYNKEKTMR